MTRARPAWLGLLLVLVPAGAHAFSDPAAFADPVELGGGGGRWFTGSPADGYTCNVCHAGGEAATLRITGLPLAGYFSDTAYEVSIEWPSTLEHIGLALEITDRGGMAAGGLRLPPEGELPEIERCEPYEDVIAAGSLTALENRNVLSVPDCGAHRVRFLWTAPAAGRGAVWFSGGFVHSDDQADDRGDGVTLFAHAIGPLSEKPALASDIRAGCSVAAGRRAPVPVLGLVGLGLALLRARSLRSVRAPRARRTPG